MVIVNEKEFSNVVENSAQIRYEYFIKKVADKEEVWGVFDDGWGLAGDDYNNKVFPVWPQKEFAQACCVDEWEKYNPVSIDLYDFLDNWIDGLCKDHIAISVFYTISDKGVVINPDDLKLDIQNELENY